MYIVEKAELKNRVVNIMETHNNVPTIYKESTMYLAYIAIGYTSILPNNSYSVKRCYNQARTLTIR